MEEDFLGVTITTAPKTLSSNGAHFPGVTQSLMFFEDSLFYSKQANNYRT